MKDPIHVIVTTDEDGYQAMYFGGDLKQYCETIYACDIALAVGDAVIQFSHVKIDHAVETWPEHFEQLLVKSRD